MFVLVYNPRRSTELIEITRLTTIAKEAAVSKTLASIIAATLSILCFSGEVLAGEKVSLATRVTVGPENGAKRMLSELDRYSVEALADAKEAAELCISLPDSDSHCMFFVLSYNRAATAFGVMLRATAAGYLEDDGAYATAAYFRFVVEDAAVQLALLKNVFLRLKAKKSLNGSGQKLPELKAVIDQTAADFRTKLRSIERAYRKSGVGARKYIISSLYDLQWDRLDGLKPVNVSKAGG